MTTARPQAGDTRKRTESTTRTKGLCAVSASVVERVDRRRSGAGSVVTARAIPPESASVGVWTAGAGPPRAAVAPGSLTVTTASPRIVRPPISVATTRRHAPGLSIGSVATYETSFTPGGWMADAVTTGPNGTPAIVASWTVGCRLVSASRLPPTDRARMIGPAGPDQIDVETTSTPRGVGVGIAVVADGASERSAVSSATRCRRRRGGNEARRRRRGDGVRGRRRRGAHLARNGRHHVSPGAVREASTEHPGSVDEIDIGRVRHAVAAVGRDVLASVRHAPAGRRRGDLGGRSGHGGEAGRHVAGELMEPARRVPLGVDRHEHGTGG